MNQTLEFRVGLLTLLACTLFIWLVGKVEDYQPFKKIYRIGVTFHDVQRLVVGDPVRLNGLPVGKVKLMGFKDGLVLTWLEIEQLFPVSRKAKISVGTAGFFGANYIKITQPIVEDRSAPGYLPDGEIVSGSEEPGIDRLVQEGEDLMTSARVTVDALNKLLGDARFRDDIKDTARNLKASTEKAQQLVSSIDARVDEVGANLRKLTENINGAVEDNRAGVKRSVEELEKMLTELRSMSQDNRARFDRIVFNLDALAADLNQGETAGKLKGLLDDVKKLVADYSSGGKIGTELAASAKNMTAITTDLKSVSSKAKDFVTDPATSDKVEQVITDVHDLSKQSRDLGGELDKFKFDLRNNTLYRFETENFRNDVTAVASYNDEYYAYLGHEFIGRAQGLNTVQLGTRLWKDFIVRSGAFRDKNGAGVDYEFLDKKAMVSLEGFQFRDPIVRLIGRYRINDDFNLMVRRENVNRTNAETQLGVEHHF